MDSNRLCHKALNQVLKLEVAKVAAEPPAMPRDVS
jgi:hypothetical protein